MTGAIRHLRMAVRSHNRLALLRVRFQRAVVEADEKQAALVADQISARLDVTADHLEASRLARTFSGHPAPAELRRQAERWDFEASRSWALAGAGEDKR